MISKKPSIWVYCAVVLTGLFLWVGIFGYPDWNMQLFRWLNRTANWSDAFWQNITVFGEGLVAIVLVASFAQRSGRLVWLALLAAVIAGVATQGFKSLFDMPRPAAIDFDNLIVLGDVLRSRSFPSGHATTAFVGATLLSSVFVHQRYLLYVSAALVAFSRISVGAHWPLDVIAGACLGYLCGVATLTLAVRIPIAATKSWQPIVAWLLVLGCALWLMLFDLDYPKAQILVWMLACAGMVRSLWHLLKLTTTKKGV